MFKNYKSLNCLCTKEYMPVCAISPDGYLNTYSNQCTAECNDATTSYSGVCNSDCICPEVYMPVCALVNGSVKIYSNKCFASCEKATIISNKECDISCAGGYIDGDTWTSSDGCSQYYCDNGIIQTAIIDCQWDLPCLIPIYIPGECCPICFKDLTLQELITYIIVFVRNTFN